MSNAGWFRETVNYSFVIPVGTRVRVTGRSGRAEQGKTGEVTESFRQQPSRIGCAKVRLDDGEELWFETKELRPA